MRAVWAGHTLGFARHDWLDRYALDLAALLLESFNLCSNGVTFGLFIVGSLHRLPDYCRRHRNHASQICRRPAVLHDWLYCLKTGSRADADQLFLEALKAEGVGWAARWSMYTGVRAGGWVYWNRRQGLELDDFAGTKKPSG